MYSKLSVNVHFRKCFVHDLLWPKWFCAGIRLEQNDWVFFMGSIAEVVDRANNKFPGNQSCLCKPCEKFKNGIKNHDLWDYITCLPAGGNY